MDPNDERVKRALRRRPYVLNPVRVNTPDSVMWPTGKVRRRPRPSTSAQTPQIHIRPPIIVSCGQEQTSGDVWDIHPEPLIQCGRVTRLMERNHDRVISSSSSDDISIYSFTDCESESDDEDNERRTPLLKMKDGKVTKLEVRDMEEDNDLFLSTPSMNQTFCDNDASAEDSPGPSKEPQRKGASLKHPQLIIVTKPNIPLPASVSALKKASHQLEVVPTVRPCREQLDKKKQWRIKENLASMELDLEEGLKTINQERQKKNGGCFRARIEKWMGRRKEERLRDEDVNREDKMRTGEESPGKLSGRVSGQTGLSPLVTSAPLRALPSAVVPPSPEDDPKPLTPPSPVPVIVALPAVEYLPYHCSPRLAPITNLSENSRKLLQKISGVAPQVRGNTESSCLAPITNTGSPHLTPITNLNENSRKLLQEMAHKMAGVAPQEGKGKRKKGKAKKRVKQEKASKMQQVGNVGERKDDKKEEKKSLRKRFLQWLLRCLKK